VCDCVSVNYLLENIVYDYVFIGYVSVVSFGVLCEENGVANFAAAKKRLETTD